VIRYIHIDTSSVSEVDALAPLRTVSVFFYSANDLVTFIRLRKEIIFIHRLWYKRISEKSLIIFLSINLLFF